jgi:hypothetical protein
MANGTGHWQTQTGCRLAHPLPCPEPPHLPDTPLQQFQLMLLNLNFGGGALLVLCQFILHRLGLG